MRGSLERLCIATHNGNCCIGSWVVCVSGSAVLKQGSASLTQPDMQASTTVRHLMLPCHWSQRTEVTSALVACYGALGSTIVFTETKRTADELASALGESLGARALHGDIPQTQREVRAGVNNAMSF